MKNPQPNTIPDALWDQLVLEDPASAVIFASSPWQGVTALSFTADLKDETWDGAKDSKAQAPEWRIQQDKCWNKYRRFGPVNASINSKADYVTGAGFKVDSPVLQIRQALKSFWYGMHNQLYKTSNSWLVRMQSEGELFLLFSIAEVKTPEKFQVKIRVLEPSRIGDGNETGLIVNPSDATETLFYEHKTSAGTEIIPDIRIAFNPELAKLKLSTEIDKAKLKTSQGGGKFSKLGGFNRFFLHWKNLTGIVEYERDISSLSSVLEYINLYENSIKWRLDHLKAMSAYTNIVKFTETPLGKASYYLFMHMTDEQRAKTGLTKQLKPGGTLILMPGVEFDVKNPNLGNLPVQDPLLNLTGSGLRSPMDLFQGNASGLTNSTVEATRSPYEADIETLQTKHEDFLRWEVLRSYFWILTQLAGFPATFKKKEVEEIVGGKGKIVEIDVEPCELVNISSPNIKFTKQPLETVQAYLGSKHPGLHGIGVSADSAAKALGVDDLHAEKRKQILEIEEFGEIAVAPDQGTPAKDLGKPKEELPKEEAP